jgi:hypothetical protein
MLHARCRVCKRLLRNPVSVKLGIGPVCRIKNTKQGEFSFMHAHIEGVKHKRRNYTHIDTGYHGEEKYLFRIN